MTQTTYQVILCADGKHQVVVTSDNQGEMQMAGAWARATFEALQGQYGLRQEQQTPSTAEEETAPICSIHRVPMVRVNGRKGPFWSCHERNQDGSFCNYRPKGQ